MFVKGNSFQKMSEIEKSLDYVGVVGGVGWGGISLRALSLIMLYSVPISKVVRKRHNSI